MTEGPTARLRAIQINQRFRDETVKDVFVRSKKLYVEPSLLIGKSLKEATSFGKNILLYFDEYMIRMHLMMYGSIRFEKNYSKPFEQVRLTVFFPKENLVVYNAPIVEIGAIGRLEEELFKNYGVDPLTNWDGKRLIQLVLKHKRRKIGDLLLDQSVFNGVGNILRNEVLFRAGINPEKKVEEMAEEEVKKVATYVKRLSHSFLELKKKGMGLKPVLLVYNKKYCPRCGGKLLFYRQEPNLRKTFYCLVCQK